MFNVGGYEPIAQIHRSARTFAWRAKRSEDGRPVVLKMLAEEVPSAATVAAFQREFELAKVAADCGGAGVFALETGGGQWVLVTEDFGGVSLRTWLADHRPSTDEALRIGAQIADAIAGVHQAGIVHKDINPSNIVFNPGTGALKLIDFGLSTRLGREKTALCSANVLKGTLPYIAPEQTGRMNRTVDRRADLYSLGVTLYELFTGHRPFESDDPAELVHMHLAVVTRAPADVAHDVPRPVSDVIMRLLAKMADDRYQTARGVADDLKRCREGLSADDVFDFVPAVFETSDRFDIPQRLYGRQREVAELIAAVEKTAGGPIGLSLVAGHSGIGKSALVHEIHRPLTALGGRFASGKFDQLRRDEPYLPFIEALTDIVDQLLTEPENVLSAARKRIEAALGDNGGVIAQVIPTIERVIGPQATPASLGATYAQQRFLHVFERFLSALATPASPIALFLDDLQWADTPSLSLIEALLTQSEVRNVVLIGAYRDNEVDDGHPLNQLVERLTGAGHDVAPIVLGPLHRSHILQLIADTLQCDASRAAPLVDLVVERTGGNPFFAHQLLKHLHGEGLVAFDHDAGAWTWSLARIRARGVTDDVVALMVQKLGGLPESCRNAIVCAAFAGHRFDLQTVALLSESDPATVARDLYPALQADLVVPADERWRLAGLGGEDNADFRFVHDRVHEAAYRLVPADERGARHLRFGQLLLDARGTDDTDDGGLFELAHHLNLGVEASATSDVRVATARIDLRAGLRAKASAAWGPALAYFEAGRALLDDSSWQTEPELAESLHIEAMDAHYINGNEAAGDELSELMLTRTDDVLTKVRIHEVRATTAMKQFNLPKARDEGYAAMRLLGVEFPEDIDAEGFGAAIGSTLGALGGRTGADLLALPTSTDERHLAAQRVAMILVPPTFMMNPLLCLTIQLKSLESALEHGMAPETPYFVGGLAVIHVTALGQFEAGVDLAKAAVALIDRMPAGYMRAKVYMVAYGFAVHYTTHLRNIVDKLRIAADAGMDCGDIEFAGYSAGHYCHDLFVVGEPLANLTRQHDHYAALLRRHGQAISEQVLRLTRQAIVHLVTPTDAPATIDGDFFKEDIELAAMMEFKNYSAVSCLYCTKTIVAGIFRDGPATVAHAAAGEPFLEAQMGLPFPVLHNFYQSLGLLQTAPNVDEESRVEALAKVEANQAILKQRADAAEESWLHRWQMVEAERKRVHGDELAALELLETAAKGALETGHLHDEALAYELRAELYVAMQRPRLASDSVRTAANAWRRWGAEAKVADLEARYPEAFVTSRGSSSRGTGATASTTDSKDGSAIDLATVLKAAQTLTGEIHQDKLLDKLMRILIENAGAQRGVLLLADDAGELRVAAEQGVELTQASSDSGTHDDRAPMSVVSYAVRCGEAVVLEDAGERFGNDPWIRANGTRSVMCAPLLNQGRLVAVAYLENNLSSGAFTADRLEVLRLLSSQAALSIHNAGLYARLEDANKTLERRVEERTEALRARNDELGRALRRLRDTQRQLVHQEKLASLGQLTTGVAHEIRNPLNFINNFSELSVGLVDEIGEIVDEEGDALSAEARDEIGDVMQTLKDNLATTARHGKRANAIVESMLLHARASSGERVATDINRLLEQAIALANSGQGGDDGPAVKVDVTLADDAGTAEISASDISRVLVNIVSNALWAMGSRSADGQAAGWEPVLNASTRADGDDVVVTVRDNGIGIPASMREKVTRPFFTTKPPGEGTGLGLSVSHDIVQAHLGSLDISSEEGVFTEVCVRLPRAAHLPA